MSEDITQIILSVLGGTALGAFLNFRLGQRKQNQSEFEAIVHELKDLRKEDATAIKQYKSKIEDLEEKVFELLTEIRKLNKRLKEYEQAEK